MVYWCKELELIVDMFVQVRSSKFVRYHWCQSGDLKKKVEISHLKFNLDIVHTNLIWIHTNLNETLFSTEYQFYIFNFQYNNKMLTILKRILFHFITYEQFLPFCMWYIRKLHTRGYFFDLWLVAWRAPF